MYLRVPGLGPYERDIAKLLLIFEGKLERSRHRDTVKT